MGLPFVENFSVQTGNFRQGTGMKVTRVQIVIRGLTNCCPNCGGRTLFKAGTLFEVNPTCPQCGLKLGRDEGFFLGSLSLNYGVTLLCYLLPVLLLAYYQVIGTTTAIVLAGAGSMLVPALLYRPSRSWFLMNYFFFLPQHLPVNKPAPGPGQDESA